jgi:hypothetical protein
MPQKRWSLWAKISEWRFDSKNRKGGRCRRKFPYLFFFPFDFAAFFFAAIVITTPALPSCVYNKDVPHGPKVRRHLICFSC